MNQQLLKNIHDTFGETKFRYHSRLCYVSLNDDGDYELKYL